MRKIKDNPNYIFDENKKRWVRRNPHQASGSTLTGSNPSADISSSQLSEEDYRDKLDEAFDGFDLSLDDDDVLFYSDEGERLSYSDFADAVAAYSATSGDFGKELNSWSMKTSAFTSGSSIKDYANMVACGWEEGLPQGWERNDATGEIEVPVSDIVNKATSEDVTMLQEARSAIKEYTVVNSGIYSDIEYDAFYDGMREYDSAGLVEEYLSNDEENHEYEYPDEEFDREAQEELYANVLADEGGKLYETYVDLKNSGRIQEPDFSADTVMFTLDDETMGAIMEELLDE